MSTVYKNRKGSVTPHQSAIDRLKGKRAAKMEQQRQLADDMNKRLTRKWGYNDNTARSMRNLECAIGKSKAPGTFPYHKPPPDIAKAEKNNDFGKMNKQLNEMQKEILQIDRDIEQAQKKKQLIEDSRQKVAIMTMSQWFDTFGVPKPEPAPGYVTRFTPSSKVYGGTNHYSGFKTVATTMKQARMTI